MHLTYFIYVKTHTAVKFLTCLATKHCALTEQANQQVYMFRPAEWHTLACSAQPALPLYGTEDWRGGNE